MLEWVIDGTSRGKGMRLLRVRDGADVQPVRPWAQRSRERGNDEFIAVIAVITANLAYELVLSVCSMIIDQLAVHVQASLRQVDTVNLLINPKISEISKRSARDQ